MEVLAFKLFKPYNPDIIMFLADFFCYCNIGMKRTSWITESCLMLCV